MPSLLIGYLTGNSACVTMHAGNSQHKLCRALLHLYCLINVTAGYWNVTCKCNNFNLTCWKSSTATVINKHFCWISEMNYQIIVLTTALVFMWFSKSKFLLMSLQHTGILRRTLEANACAIHKSHQNTHVIYFTTPACRKWHHYHFEFGKIVSDILIQEI